MLLDFYFFIIKNVMIKVNMHPVYKDKGPLKCFKNFKSKGINEKKNALINYSP